MYDVLYIAWLKEKQNAELQDLSRDFYVELANYVRRIRREGRMLDKYSAKAKLISKELVNVQKLMKELSMLRFKKMVNRITVAESLKKEALTIEEERVLLGMRPLFEEFRSFLKDSLRGKVSKVERRVEPSKRALLRFVKEVPAVVGADLKIYGPFSVEDVATLPIENAKVFVKQGVAMEVETE